MKNLALISAMILSLVAVTPAMALPTVVNERPMAVVQLDHVPPPRPSVRYAQSNRQISAAEAKRIALSRVRGGEVVDIRRTADAYRVRVIARDGRVVDIVVDARTGRVR